MPLSTLPASENSALHVQNPTTAPRINLLLVDCPDRSGLIHQITGLLASTGANIIANDEFVDRERARFYMRTEFTPGRSLDGLMAALQDSLPRLANVRLSSTQDRRRIVVFASREPHCAGELLIRNAYGDLRATLAALVSNHESLRTLATRFDVPFHYVPHEGLDRAGHEERIFRVLDELAPDYLVLAKYMRVLTPEFVDRYRDRIINIHHSFLPAFIGSDPYRQAFHRGVKIIGATAHFVTERLDEGPIIAQSVLPVDHSYRAEEMARAGRDVEKMVLATALRLVLEDRVFLNGNRTIVFE